MRDARGGNPYDFRTPIKRRHQLASRDDLLEELDGYMRAAAVGNPVHISIFGTPGVGKSSLLNGLVDVAEDRGLLTAKLDLRAATVETEVAFYTAVIDAALQRLIDVDAITASDPLVHSWTRLTRSGEAPPDSGCPPFEVALLAAAKLNGKMVSGVPVAALKRDLNRLLGLGEAQVLRGLVLCLDNAHHIDSNRDIAPSLIELANATDALTIVSVAENSGTLQDAAPRAWAQVEVRPFGRASEVFSAIARPLQDVEEHELAPTLPMAADIRTLTGGHPYEVRLVCYFIWEAIQRGEQDDFALSQPVIEQVLSELEEKGRHNAGAGIAALGELKARDYEVVTRIVPYENLTIRQIALLRLLLSDYDEDELSLTEQEVRHDLQFLNERGVVAVEQDRFSVTGGPDARMYLKYAAQRHTKEKLRFRASYARLATKACVASLVQEINGGPVGEDPLISMIRPQEVGGSSGEGWLNGLTEAVEEANLVSLAELIPSTVDLVAFRAHADKGSVLVGLELQIGLHHVEFVELAVNSQELSASDIRARTAEWIDENQELLSKYDIEVAAWTCEVLPSPITVATVSYSQLRLWSVLSFFMYDAGIVQAAIGALVNCVGSVEELLGDASPDPLIRAELADAYNRLGFMTSTQGSWDDAMKYFDKGRTLALDDSWLLDFNTAYICSRRHNAAEALEAISRVDEMSIPREGRIVLHGGFPSSAEWKPPSRKWNVVSLHGGWTLKFVRLQRAVYEAQVAPEALEALEVEVTNLGGTAPPPLLRLAGWAELTILRRPDRAVELFDRAVNASRLEEVAEARAEAAYARALADASASDEAA